MFSKTCCFTGHRPEKLPWGFHEDSEDCVKLKKLLYGQAEQLVKECGVTHFICGMARGIDTYAAEAVLQLKMAYPVTLECAIPFEEQAISWLETDRERFFIIAGRADRETMLQRRYTQDCYLKRNRYIVDRSLYVVAVWDGSGGGTGYTVRYASEKGRTIRIIHPAHLIMPLRAWTANRSNTET